MTTLISPPWAKWYWTVNDSNPAAKVYSTAAGAYVNNNAAAFLTWLADANFGAASGLGSGLAITAAADNGAGKTRLTVSTTANVATGQYFYFGPNGVQQITVIDATHIDLTGLAFGSYVATAAMQGATIIDTDANLRKHLNTVALRSNAAGANTVTSSTDVTLTNPIPLYVNVNMTVGSKKLIWPPMNTPQSLPIGTPLVIENFGNASFGIYLNDGTTPLAFCQGGNGTSGTGEKVLCELTDNSTPNGTIKATSVQRNTSLYGVSALFAKNNAGSPNTKMDATFNAVVVVKDGNLTEPRSVSFLPSSLTMTIDTGAVGPAAGGRDQAAAFGASQFIHFFAIFSPDQGTNGLPQQVSCRVIRSATRILPIFSLSTSMHRAIWFRCMLSGTVSLTMVGKSR